MFQRFPLAVTLCSVAVLACAGADSGSPPTEATVNTTGPDGCGCPAQPVEYVYQPLTCVCGPESDGLCPTTLDEALAVMCPPGGRQTVLWTEGCGKVSLGGPGGYVGASQTFDAESGRLIGVYEYSDIPGGRCNAFGHISGDALFVGSGLIVGPSCPEGDFCMACGTGAYPACDR